MAEPLFEPTGLVLPKCDRDVSAWIHIDHLKEEIYLQRQTIGRLERELENLKTFQIQKLTDSGIWKVVQTEQMKKRIKWENWAFKLAAGGVFLAGLKLVKKKLNLDD